MWTARFPSCPGCTRSAAACPHHHSPAADFLNFFFSFSSSPSGLWAMWAGRPPGRVRSAPRMLAGLSTPRHCPSAARRRGCGQCGQAGRRDASDEHQGDNRPGCPSGVVRPAATQPRTRHQGPRAAGLSTPRHCPSVACVGDTAANETSEPGSKASGHAAGRRLGGLGMLDAQQGWRNLRRTSRRMRRSSGPLRSTLPAHGWPDTSGPAAMEVRQ